jgi:N-acetylglutamate synthase-like GNAT family acetyltransferase
LTRRSSPPWGSECPNKATRSFVCRAPALKTAPFRTQGWFELLGFRKAGVESLSESCRRIYDRSRRSKVFTLEL